jgi:hypothetical protein
VSVQPAQRPPKQNRHHSGSQRKTNRDVSENGYVRQRVLDDDKSAAPHEGTKQERKVGANAFTQDFLRTNIERRV